VNSSKLLGGEIFELLCGGAQAHDGPHAIDLGFDCDRTVATQDGRHNQRRNDRRLIEDFLASRREYDLIMRYQLLSIPR